MCLRILIYPSQKIGGTHSPPLPLLDGGALASGGLSVLGSWAILQGGEPGTEARDVEMGEDVRG
jgi:hypothetical protein